MVAGDKVHHVTECELALGETKPGDQVLWPEAGNLKKSMLTGMLAASYQWRQLLLLFNVLHIGEGGIMRDHQDKGKCTTQILC